MFCFEQARIELTKPSGLSGSEWVGVGRVGWSGLEWVEWVGVG